MDGTLNTHWQRWSTYEFIIWKTEENKKYGRPNSEVSNNKKQISIDHARGKTELSVYSPIENNSKFILYDEALKEYAAKNVKNVLRSESGT